MDSKPSPNFDPWITLNVGGQLFRARKSTLTSSISPNMFTAMFGGAFMAEPDSNGHYCFDRDPKHFRKILNFFRTGQIVMPNEGDREKAIEMLLEAQFYSVEPMILRLTEHLGVALPTGGRYLRLLGSGSGIPFPNLEWRGGPVTVEYWHRCTTEFVGATLFNFQNFIHDETTSAEYNDHRFLNHTPWTDANTYFDYGGVKASWPQLGRIHLQKDASFYKKWIHVAFVSEGAGGNNACIYFNGKLAIQQDRSDESSPCNNFILGGTHRGDLAHFRIWKRARSQEEIEESMASKLTGQEDGLFFYLPLDDTTPGRMTDLVSGQSATFDATIAKFSSDLE